MNWQVPAAQAQVEYEVKKSRFIARVLPVSSREEVNAEVARARADYPDARHHCWAYLLGRPADATGAGMSDDGEPAGTAGKPILNVLQHGELGDVLVIVVRYFGGIKLGAGGLVRAYGSAARLALEAAPVRERRSLLHCEVRGDFAHEQQLRHFLQGVEGELLEVEYAQPVCFLVALPEGALEALAGFCAAQDLHLLRP
ncbi:YigZ family protein [Mangrovimicrobium sediminis]|uniref:YigZ family protein n=1 Tax=Mangrovimicrobium sediminis TaxID=2562682 RepID=A0A4Z0M5W2_9GAMM|nr:YigZ family protein [Haliea sp. SAOS-164]TGD74695.1 YigZ family protein [Haliea sp. SAOS-164]